MPGSGSRTGVVISPPWKLDYFGGRCREFETISILPDELSCLLFIGFEPTQSFRGFSKKLSKQRIRFEYDLIPCFRQGLAYAVFADFALEYPLGRFESFPRCYIGLGKQFRKSISNGLGGFTQIQA